MASPKTLPCDGGPRAFMSHSTGSRDRLLPFVGENRYVLHFQRYLLTLTLFTHAEHLEYIQGCNCTSEAAPETKRDFMHQAAYAATSLAEKTWQPQLHMFSCGTQRSVSCSFRQPAGPPSWCRHIPAGLCCMPLCGGSNSSDPGAPLHYLSC